MTATKKTTKKEVKNPALKISARKHPWLNFLRQFRQKHHNKDVYKGPNGHKMIMVDAAASYKNLSPDDKKQYYEYIPYEKDVVGEPEKSVEEIVSVETKKTRAKK